ncbi:MAG: MBL fold metallo-hydrolase [Eubacteriales bacterium]
MENGGTKIKRVKLYHCGFCVNNLAYVFRHQKKETVSFPALAVLIVHEKQGNILYDTGYSRAIYENGLVSKLYNLLNRTYVRDQDQINRRLLSDGVRRIDRIILSHPHPDHIGALNCFDRYELISTKETLQSLKDAKLRSLVFRNMIPKGNIRERAVERMSRPCFLKEYFDEVYDILGDGSLIGVRLDGHSRGQLGVYIPEYRLFLAADSSWGEGFLDKVGEMRLIPRLIQDDFDKYKEVIGKLRRLRSDHPEITIRFSHERGEERTYEPKT